MLLSWKIGNRQVARYRWKGFGTSDLFDTPDFPGTNKQIEENRVIKRKRRHRRSADVRINWLQPHADGQALACSAELCGPDNS
ncbi:hypothetical protein BMJ34_22955 [Sinorhizobium medicae]|uniref:Uncharacterized protein n=2 Tax=Sinorhizobium medicae TaxID=110321 RepID=A6UJJ4_SINMW|nr:hypothetical protein Smed_5045 [Sinorhizobium medicae WSM419]MDX0653815.1 hypothetical protein [Sinorhizobium medicae]PLT92846.1 hypothetical protein BMJ33_32740 [Sinorhizobium medicae]PLT94131.1 hypothetical protein BMJ34_22955 [Sinorhizobium medicae]PLU11042.1 hypothetical protein BMJ30_31535 [Sinorhizobium medicae]